MSLQPFTFAKRVPNISPIGAAQATSYSDLIPFSYGTPSSDLFPYEQLQKAATAAILEQGRDSLQYAGAKGPSLIQEWIAKRSSLREINIQPNQVLVTYGSQQAIDHVARTILEVGDHVWLEAPTYFGAVNTFKTSEAILTSFPIDGDGLRVDLVKQALIDATNEGRAIPKFIYVMPNFHNPGGVSLSLERRKQLAQLAYQYNFFIIEDDAYVELAFEGKYLPAIYTFAPERTIYLSSFSKIIAPGIRLGWAIADADVIKRMNTFFQGSKASVFSQEIVAQLLNSFSFEAHLEYLNSTYRSNRDVMVAELREKFGTEIEFEIPKGGFFVWIKFPKGVNTGHFVQDAYTRGLSFISGTQFYIEQDGERFARLSFSYCNHEQIKKGVAIFADTYRHYIDNKKS